MNDMVAALLKQGLGKDEVLRVLDEQRTGYLRGRVKLASDNMLATTLEDKEWKARTERELSKQQTILTTLEDAIAAIKEATHGS